LAAQALKLLFFWGCPYKKSIYIKIRIKYKFYIRGERGGDYRGGDRGG
jgi:hypothetical protein